MSHPEFLKQKFEKRGCRERSVPAGVRGVPAEKPFSRVAVGDARGERSGAQPRTPVKGPAALCNPAFQAA